MSSCGLLLVGGLKQRAFGVSSGGGDSAVGHLGLLLAGRFRVFGLGVGGGRPTGGLVPGGGSGVFSTAKKISCQGAEKKTH